MNKQKLIEKWESAIESAKYYGKDKEDRLIEYMRDFIEDLTQLDEPEVILDKAFEKVAESYSMTKEEVWQHLEQLEARTEVLSQDWIDEHTWQAYDPDGRTLYWVVSESDLEELLVPKQEKVDRAYKDGYEKGKKYATEKQSGETETVASVMANYFGAATRLQEVLNMEVEELEE